MSEERSEKIRTPVVPLLKPGCGRFLGCSFEHYVALCFRIIWRNAELCGWHAQIERMPGELQVAHSTFTLPLITPTDMLKRLRKSLDIRQIMLNAYAR